MSIKDWWNAPGGTRIPRNNLCAYKSYLFKDDRCIWHGDSEEYIEKFNNVPYPLLVGSYRFDTSNNAWSRYVVPFNLSSGWFEPVISVESVPKQYRAMLMIMK